MTDDRTPGDDQLLSYLKDALDSDVDADAVDLIMTGYDIVQMDTVESLLEFDSFAATGVRDAESGVRRMSFTHEDVAFEVAHDAAQLTVTGKVEPPGGVLYLDQLSGSTRIDLTDRGSFDARVEGAGAFRLRYEIGGSSVSTPWIDDATD